MGITAFQELKQTTPLSRDSDVNSYVSCVANALTGVLDQDQASQPQQWEVSVFANEQINAFALPGGKIGVYEGLLSVAENQDQLATVVAHEIAHVLARHSNERISTQYVTSTGLELASVLAGQNTPAKQTLFGLLGLGAHMPKELMLFVKNLVFLDGAIARLAPDLDLFAEIALVAAILFIVNIWRSGWTLALMAVAARTSTLSSSMPPALRRRAEKTRLAREGTPLGTGSPCSSATSLGRSLVTLIDFLEDVPPTGCSASSLDRQVSSRLEGQPGGA